ncbi:MAG: 30S ribosomal protein S18 [Deltaproteobacteria bacterium]|nr:30S ribosomal protein S18 [Deltaproteobacteria bacterium]
MQNRARRGPSTQRNRPYYKRKTCRFCEDKNLKIDYKSPQVLRNLITERGKILPRRITGTCSRHQRELTLEIKRARIMALLPFSVHD